jgi:dUTP pyrophosphatase
MSDKENSYTFSIDYNTEFDPYASHILSSNTLKVHKCRPNAKLPSYGTSTAACFDLQACYKKYDEIAYYTRGNQKSKLVVRDSNLILYPGQRMLVPTGLIFDLAPNQSVRIHPRSGLALKNGIVVVNCEGVVDSDYVHETFVMLQNISDIDFEIAPGMRIAQAEVVTVNQCKFVEVSEAPGKKTDREGGFGSTGTK